LHPASYSDCCGCRDFQVLKLLIDAGADVNIRDEKGHTPIHEAALHTNIEFMKILIGKRADVNVKDEKGWTPLHWAVSNRHFQVVKLLIDAGADVNIRDERIIMEKKFLLGHCNMVIKRLLCILKSTVR